MWTGWDLIVFQSFFKVSEEKLCFQEMFLWSTGGDELRTGYFGGTSHPQELSAGGSWRLIPSSLLHASMVLM